MRRYIAPLCFAVVSCTGSNAPYEIPTRAYTPTSPVQQPWQPNPGIGPFKVLRSNSSIARDILQLTFFLENGNPLNTFTRFEGPISVRVLGHAPATMQSDLNLLLDRLRTEAGIDIRLTSSENANITLQMIPRAQIKKLVPNAACFVAPNVTGLSDYLVNKQATNGAWTRMSSRNTMAIFLPADASPQEVRDCMHEELSQALGPVNDIYALSDSIFNDDNVHAVLTDFDMLTLRALYDPMLSNGMSRGDVAARLSIILSRLNPIGDTLNGEARFETVRKWNDAVAEALGAGTSDQDRVNAAERAVSIANKHGFHDVRLGFSYFILGRVSTRFSSAISRSAFEQSEAAYAKLKGTELHRAYVASQLAAYSLAAGDAKATLDRARSFIPVARSHENYALLSTLQLLEAEALDLLGQTADAKAVRLDSLSSARYGFGSETAVQARLREIAALSPR